ncbi:MAG: hypothetical protein KF764_04375 [Labilithrix sp.]|nr:hypothetical protein [Labilithrix sp.]MBX3225415.1 hypothetical protein [Labilithrix sp.]
MERLDLSTTRGRCHDASIVAAAKNLACGRPTAWLPAAPRVLLLLFAPPDYAASMPRTGTRTMDGASILRAMVIALTPEQEEACRRALVPVEVVRASDVRAACASMSMVLPLVVVVDEAISDADRAELTDFATVCGAEIVAIERTPPGAGYAARLLDAVRAAERRRVGARG